jgi:hypothetical protein
MKIDEGKYWDKACNVIINPNCRCEVYADCWFHRDWNRFKKNIKNWEFDDKGVGFNASVLRDTMNTKIGYTYSMNWWGDWADYDVEPTYIIWNIVAACLINDRRAMVGRPINNYLFLTKRPQRLESCLKQFWPAMEPLYKKGVWLGLSVTGLVDAGPDIYSFLQIPHFKKWLSIEPLMGDNIPVGDFKKFDQIILGGYNGAGAPDIPTAAFKHIIAVAQEARVPIFFKGWGSKSPKINTGRLMDGKEYNNLAWRDPKMT